jgi:hypothetical protein
MSDTSQFTLDVQDVAVGYGSVTFVKGHPGRPATSTTTETQNGTTTVHDAEIAPMPDRFDVTFMVSAKIIAAAPDGARLRASSPILQLSVPVSAAPAETGAPRGRYSDIEDHAAHALPGLLRQIAAGLDEQIAETDARRSREKEN